MKKQSLIPKSDYDARWKVIIERLHQYFMLFFLPSLYRKIDFSIGVKVLDKEVQKLFADWTKKGWRAGDKLLEYHLKKTDKKQLILVYVEVEYSGKLEFKELLFVRIRRLMDKYPDSKITAIVLYCGENIPRNHSVYVYEFEGLKITCEFNAYVIKRQKVKELLASNNPFALVILACLYNLKSKNDMDKRLSFKLKLARLCFERRWDKQQIADMLIFITYTVAIPKEKEDIYIEEIVQNLNIKTMAIIDEPYHKSSIKVIEFVLYGKTLDEIKEEDKKENELLSAKKYIINSHEKGLSEEDIATIVELELSFVRSVIEENASEKNEE